MNSNDQAKIINRLTKIEGQVRGLQRMVSEEQSCTAILTQIAAVRGALAKVAKTIFEEHSRTCIQQVLEAEEQTEEALEELLQALGRLLK